MRIKSLHLKNIRSYLDDRIEFPEGSVLLSGDIGSGKSTLLHAIEFALFGLRKDVSGTDLLRHGKSSGSVKLDFQIDGKDVSIERTLKRSRHVAQDSGKLVVDNQPYELMPSELKSKILEMFGYSRDMLKKDKPLFRFTVYTPQEQMKQILLGEENRLNILRSVFDVDKYGTIRNNARIFMTELRAVRRECEARMRDADVYEKRLDEMMHSKKSVQDQLMFHRDKLRDVSAKFEAKKKELDAKKKEFSEVNAAKHELTRKETDLAAKVRRLDRLKSDVYEVSDKIQGYEQMLRAARTEKPLDDLKSSLKSAEARRDELISKKAVVNSEIRKLQNIYTAGVCEFCGQKVHNPEEFMTHLEERKINIGNIGKEVGQLDSSILDLKSSISEAEKSEHTKHLLEEHDRMRTKYIEERDGIAKDIEFLKKDVQLLRPKTESYGSLQESIAAAENELHAVNQDKSSAETIVARSEQQLDDIERRIADVTAEIEEREKLKEKAARVSQLVSWLDSFVTLMENIEKHVMFAIQREFGGYFQKWFSILMADQLSVKIDDKFAPVIEQNGYATEYENLSGGEKTSVALAYRLALNKVINDMVDTIKTKDILILDEPTDGFSTDQLDRIRDVISELRLKQIIIVSHEPKIDTYVDNVVRIFKENHVSRVAY